jgi:hypothetical protein
MDRKQLVYIENMNDDSELGFYMLGHVDIEQFNAIVNEEIHGLIGEGMVQGIDSEHTYLKKKEYADYPVTHDYVIRKADKNEPGAFAATLYCEYKLIDDAFLDECEEE